MVYFPGTEYRSHTSCMSEAQKYQGALYKEKNNNKKNKGNNNNNNFNNIQPQNVPLPEAEMAQPAYFEDVPEFETCAYEGGGSDNGRSPADLLPEAPTPPSADDANVNVFDFLDGSATPNASALGRKEVNQETQLVRYEAGAYLDDDGAMVDEDPSALVQYGTGPIPYDPYETPAPKERRRKDGSEKKDKKRKRLHVDTDQQMTDAPPPLAHSGLTGGLNRMMAPSFLPPSPDYSGGDVADPALNSPLKKTKHAKHKKASEGGIGSTIAGLLNMGPGKTKTKKRKVSSTTKKHSSRHHRDGEKGPKMIEYRPGSRDGKKDGEEGQMVVYRPRADLFLSLVNKGPESEKGCSMNKALKRFHRDRSSSSDSLGKLMEEKELWRSLRMRKNSRGEIVLFTV
ncbi:hypothetical protein C8034_v012387 [Colletotrichum sidae]|uniref:Zinc finger C2H2 LYAR-type domain-containing protein n=3 Tax=Colletotrichum orbiculare species complex TaxID=2707354 RepID=A0A4R8RXJ0_COLTR|nr:hypothetical protein C8035_v012051 [Colletotrichum spinosum]TDZ74315.1 hypothetical protein CTRI78_v000807 [Colletotrichum trifolii]TEA16591.1 hypothetical protein C8034_v012387 [Colletotrichum sidae]